MIRLKNAGAVKKTSVSIPYSSLKFAIAEKLKDAGYVSGIEKKGKKVKKTLDVILKYDEAGVPLIRGARRISKPGRRIYSRVADLPRIYNGLGIAILSTPRGVMSVNEARAANIGGEILCRVF